MKEKKFGFGGKKKGLKRNTKASNDDISGFPRGPAGKKSKGAGAGAPKRKGKWQRQKMRNHNKKNKISRKK